MKKKIGVILGGVSRERDVSLRSGKAVANALRRRGESVVEIGEKGSIQEGILTSGTEIAFIVLHGRYGEDGTIQKFLDDVGIPYTGSGPDASKCAMDKSITKCLFAEKGVPTPDYIFADSEPQDAVIEEVIGKMKFPVVVKPVDEGSSIGLTVVREKGGLGDAIAKAYRCGNKIIVEKYIEGDELTVGILGEAPLAVVKISPHTGHYSYEAKYTPGMTDYIVPAPLPADIYKRVQAVGLLAHRALGCRDFSRVDIRLDVNGSPWVLEVNTIPGFTETSLLPKSAFAVGIEFDALCSMILEYAHNRSVTPLRTG